MPFNVFGFTIKRTKDVTQPENIPSVVTADQQDGAVVVGADGTGYYGYAFNPLGEIKSEHDLLRRYREVAAFPEVDEAINNIVEEAIVFDDVKFPVELNLERTKLPDSIKKKFVQEFESILHLLEFDTKAHDMFRQYYVDGKLYFHLVFDGDNYKNGIADIRYIDPRKIRKIRNVKKDKTKSGVEIQTTIEEYYLYNDKGVDDKTQSGAKLTPDSVVYVNSGLLDQNNGLVLSHLQKAIKPANQLKMIEDAVVIYRLTRAPERRIFYVDVGTLPKGKAEQYVQEIMNKFRNRLIYDSATGEVADSKRHLCLAMDTRVPLLDGRTLTLNDIAAEYESGKQLWAYSCDPVTGKFAPGKITWAGVSRPNAQVMKITLDNGKTITCTPDHTFPVWNKGLVKASDLGIGESMIPHYTKKGKVNKGASSSEYEKLFNNDTGKWEFTHRLVSRWKDNNGILNEQVFSQEYVDAKKTTVHHVNCDPQNNSPENLVRMHHIDHFKLHHILGTRGGKIGGPIGGKKGGKTCKEQGKGYFNKEHPDYYAWHSRAGIIGGAKSAELGYSELHYEKAREILAEKMLDPEWNEWFREQQRKGWTEDKKERQAGHAKEKNLSARGNAAKIAAFKDPNSDVRKKHTKRYKTEYTPSILSAFVEITKGRVKFTALDLVEELNAMPDLIKEFSEINSAKVMGKQKSYDRFGIGDIGRILEQLGYSTFSQFKESIGHRNHKIVNIEYLDEKIDTGCLTIDGKEEFHNYHTFAVEAGIYVKNSMMEDFWLPRRDGSKGTEITTLPAGQSLGQMEDVEYFKNKLMRALNVPITRLIPEQGFSLGRSSEITRDELKFHKFIKRLRARFSALFIDVLKVQLIAKGIIKVEEWDEISKQLFIEYRKDNSFSELKDLEILNNRLEALGRIEPYVGKYYSRAFVQKSILRFTEDEIGDLNTEMEQEAPEQPEQEQPDEGQGNE